MVGTITNAIAAPELSQGLKGLGPDGTLYLGYPILASADETITVDAVLVSQKYGLVVFHFPKNNPHDKEFWEEIRQTQDDLCVAMKQKLIVHRPLRRGRELAVEPVIVCYLSSVIAKPVDEAVRVVDKETLSRTLKSLTPVPDDYYRPLVSTLQRVSTIKPARKRASVRKDNSRGALLKKVEREIANLDTWQNHAAIETPDAPQCIRGMAGSGKTVVLALKAAFLHARNPQWNIAVTFHTRSLYQQFKDLIRRFSFEQLGDEPDWSKLKVIHSWGSRAEPGVYSEIASAYGMQIKNFEEAATQYGRRAAFGGICEELLDAIGSKETLALYNAVLVDEAQDFPQSFFQLVFHKGVKEPRRIIWAYDELQNLSDYAVLPAEQLFGVDKNGVPLVTLRSEEGKPRQDITLPICYRNTPWALTVAHAVGFGIYRDGGLVQL